MAKYSSAIKSSARWQPADYIDGYPTLPISRDRDRANRKKILLVSVYLVLLVGSLFIL